MNELLINNWTYIIILWVLVVTNVITLYSYITYKTMYKVRLKDYKKTWWLKKDKSE